ncbi:MAG: Chemotaxis protein methyltransferase CheR [Myxococcales bacterium]|nr:Chemotaxis protein methyltransferase CheR [Myxococcales bacterium]
MTRSARESRATAVEHRLTTVGSLVQLLFEDPDPARHLATERVLGDAAWPIAVVESDAHAARFVNGAWEELFAGADPSSVLPRERLDDVFRTGVATHLSLEAIASRYFCATILPTRRAGVVTGLVVVCAEMTDDISDFGGREAERTDILDSERAARVDAERANRLKDQFLAAVSHELRTPLTTMMLWEKVLRDSSVDSNTRARALDAIHQSATAQSRLVGDLLDVSRAISGKLFIDLRLVALAELLGTAIEGVSRAARDKRITIEPDLEPGLGEVQGDANRLHQVFDNILSNAVKFTPAGGRITVSARRERSAVVIAIADNGRGIAKEFLPRLFEPFSQTEDKLTRCEGGLGLGLTIAHQLVTLHHGKLFAASDGLGRGATFTITLPVTKHRLASPALQAAAPGGAVLDGVRVLVIDDDARVRDALALLLRDAGAVVEAADSAPSARTMLTRFPADVLLCDIAMPGEDGYGFISKLRASTRGQKTPAIAVTAHATHADGRRALASGFDLHVAKPIDIEALLTSIRDLLRRRA